MTTTREANSALTVKRDSTATRQQIWDVVADGWTYSQWVVGASCMRAVDVNWPAPASTIRHSIGIWPVLLKDETVAEECLPGEQIVLIAKGWPFGAARITLRLSDIENGCRIEMSEVPVRGPLKRLPKRAALAMAWPRNRECTRRLAALAERLTPGEVDD